MYNTREIDTITGICVGNVTHSGRKEILLSCFSGTIKSLIDRKHAKKLGSQGEDLSKVTD